MRALKRLQRMKKTRATYARARATYERARATYERAQFRSQSVVKCSFANCERGLNILSVNLEEEE